MLSAAEVGEREATLAGGGVGRENGKNKQARWESAPNERGKHTKIPANPLPSQPRRRRGLLTPRTDPKVGICPLPNQSGALVRRHRDERASTASPPEVRRTFPPRIRDNGAHSPG